MNLAPGNEYVHCPISRLSPNDGFIEFTDTNHSHSTITFFIKKFRSLERKSDTRLSKILQFTLLAMVFF